MKSGLVATSVITLVFTDVVGSTAAKSDANMGSSVSIRDRAYLEAIQSKHLRLVRSAVAEHRGKEIMTIGDSFFLTFDEPLDALRCSAAIQQRLADQPIDTLQGPLRLRIGIHTGAPEFFEGSWHGHDVDTASRCQSVASPRQIIITHATRQLLGDPMGIKFRPLGTFALKGVGDLKLWDADYDYHGLRPAAVPSNEQKRRSLLTTVAVVGAILVPILLIGGWFLWQQRTPGATAAVTPAASAATPLPGGSVSSIIVADFDNKTGEPVFDTTLTQAFIIQLQQSPVITVASPQHLRQSMKFLGKSPDDPLTPAIAQEIGVREGDKAYVSGAISKIGDGYLITVSAVNPANGDTIASEQAQSEDKDKILDALSTVSTAMRTKLGESLASIQKLDTPLGQATTASLDAFRAFALGDVAHYSGRDVPDAEGHYKQALEIDPNFAVAWARLGTVYNNSGQNGKALDCFTRAFQLDKNAGESERWYIETKYYGYIVGDVQKTIDILELASQTYPLDWGSRLNLGICQSQIGRLDEALANVQIALKNAPDSAIANNAYVGGLTVLDRLQEAEAAVETWKRVDPNGTNGTTYASTVYNLHLLTGDRAAMTQDVASVIGRDDEFQMTSTVAIGQEFEGKYADADQSWKRAAVQAEAQKAGDAQAGILLSRLTGRALAEFPDDNAAAEIKAALALDDSKPTLQSAAYAAVICNQPAIAQPIMDQLAHDFPQDTAIKDIDLPSCRACLDLNAHRPHDALEELQKSEGYDAVSGIPFLQGLAYLELRDGPHAVDCFRRATKYRGAPLLNGLQDYGQAQLGLARAYAIVGDRASAKRDYETLIFDIWKNADPDLPQLVAAKKECARLL